MISCKYAAQLICLGCVLTHAMGCANDANMNPNPAWVGLNETGDFEIRSWLDTSSVQPAVVRSLADNIDVLNRVRKQSCRSVRLGAIGDTRAAFDGLGVSVFYRPMLQEMAARNAELILHVGDLVKNGTEIPEWFAYASSLVDLPPVLAVRGNHDRGPYFYDGRFGTAPVFHFDYGPARIFGLDSEGGTDAVRALLPAFEKLLALPTDKWKVVLLHRPIWSQGLHGNDEIGLNESFTKLFESYDVHLVLSGHDHNYERFCPTRGVKQDRVCLGIDSAPTYVVTGGGATMPNPVPTFWRRIKDPQASAAARTSVSYSGSLHYVELDLTPTKLTYRARRSDVGNIRSAGVIDTFHRTKKTTECTP